MRHFLILFALTISLAVQGQETWKDSIYVYARFIDNFTYELLREGSVVLTDAEGDVLCAESMKTYRSNGNEYNFTQRLRRGTTQLHLRIEAKGYEVLSQNIRIKVGRRERYVYLPDIKMRKLPQRGLTEMKEVVVEATKIRMVVRNDTIIYDADAFQLAQGSMLDGLLRMLPGFELEGGRILVNGEFVSSLLVNGNDFFKGDPRVALENLPAYMVDKVKVFRKEPDHAYITKPQNKDELPLVVDVKLKREYAVGWVANAEGGYGTHDRYMARLFGLRFTDHSRLAFFGNVNNTNDTHQPGTSGDWTPSGTASARTRMQTAGLDALIDDKRRIWKYQGEARVQHQRIVASTLTANETFQGATHSTFVRQQSEQLLRNLHVNTHHTLSLRRKRHYTTFTLGGSYRHGKNYGERLHAEFTENPMDESRGASLDTLFRLAGSPRLDALLINRTLQQSRQWGDTWHGDGSYSSFISVPHTRDYIILKANANYEHRTSTRFNDYQLHYAAGVTDRRYHYATLPEYKFSASVEASYDYRDNWGSLKPYVSLNERYAKGDYALYRLDQLTPSPDFGVLPSTLHSVLDNANSYMSESNNWTTVAGVETVIFLNNGKQNILLRPEMQWRVDRLNYQRGTLDVRPHRSSILFSPTASFRFDNFNLTYRLMPTDPDLLSMQTYRDDADPLNLRIGNPNLRRSIQHSLSVNYSIFSTSVQKKGINGRIEGYARLVQRALANAMDYDATTGVRTYMPRNVNGNWAVGTAFNYSQPVDTERRFVVSNTTAVDYQNSVDYVSARSVVRNLNVREQLSANMKWKKNLLTTKAGLRYLHAVSAQGNFANINSFDFIYGLAFQRPLWYGISFAVDGTLYQRVGYSDQSLNDLHFVVNARLAKALLKERLQLTLDVYDLFHGQSNITKTLNAQGQTETWNNSLPNYIMLRLGWRISKQPKKRNN